MRVFSVGSWAHFGSLVVSLAMLGFGLTSAVMCVAQGLVRAPLAAASAMAALMLFGPLMVAANLAAQQMPFNAIFLVSDPAQKWRLFGQLPALHAAVPGRRVLPRHRSSSRRSGFSAASISPISTGSGLCGLLFLLAMYLLHAREPARRAAAAMVRRQRAVVRGAWATGAASLALVAVAVLSAAVHFVAPPAARRAQARGLRLQGRRPTRANSPTASASTSAPRRSAIWRSIPAPICISRPASPTTPPSTCRPCRPTPISASTSTAKARSASSAICPPSETAYFRFLPMYLSLSAQAGAGHLRRPVRRRHLDGGGAQGGLRARDRGGGQSRRADGLPRRQGPARLHRRYPAQSQGQRHRLRRAALSRHTNEPLRHHRPEPGRFRRPVEPRRLRHRREVRLHARGDERATCAR